MGDTSKTRTLPKRASQIGNTIAWMNLYQLRAENIIYDLQANATDLLVRGEFAGKQQEYLGAKTSWDRLSAHYESKVREWDNAKCVKYLNTK
jgi:hypothetical protein